MSYVSKIKENRNKLSFTLNYNKRIQEKKNDSLKNNLLYGNLKITEVRKQKTDNRRQIKPVFMDFGLGFSDP